MVYAWESMIARLNPLNSERADKGTYKVGKWQGDETLTPERIQNILNTSASNHKPKPIFFAANIDYFVSELKAMAKALIDAEAIIWVLIGNIKFYTDKLRSDLKQGTENTWRKMYLQWLIDELEKRITKQLRDKLESI